MQVLHVIVGLDVGGAELMLQRLVKSSLEDESQKHLVVSLSDLGALGPQLQAEGIEVTALGMKSFLDAPLALWRLVSIMRRHRSDIVQTWMYHADLIGGIAARWSGIKAVIWGVRTTEINSRNSRATAVVRHLCARLSRFVPRAIVCAADASRKSHVAAGYDAERMIVIPNGFDTSRLVATNEQQAGLRKECGFDEENIVIGSLGRFHPDKDQKNFVAAAGLLAARHAQVRFLMVGRGLDLQNPELREWIAETGCPDRFVLLGERRDAPLCLSAMDIFCLPSRTEGFPNVVGEAMCMELPCVVTDVGDAAFLVADAGLVVPKENPTALARGMEFLVDIGRQERQTLGKKAKARILSEFSMQRAFERFTCLYKKIADKGNF
jgi:glycosyltransferase involved in cell wall biosynthesis